MSEEPCDNLCWHKNCEEIDQTAGQQEADRFLLVYTRPILEKLRRLGHEAANFTPKDIYAMQLLCCYDLVADKASPFTALCDNEDWLGFEYMRDIKYPYSEGYGAAHPVSMQPHGSTQR